MTEHQFALVAYLLVSAVWVLSHVAANTTPDRVGRCVYHLFGLATVVFALAHVPLSRLFE